MEKSCENCAKVATCQKIIGFMYGFCNADFQPKETEVNDEEGRKAESL